MAMSKSAKFHQTGLQECAKAILKSRLVKPRQTWSSPYSNYLIILVLSHVLSTSLRFS